MILLTIDGMYKLTILGCTFFSFIIFYLTNQNKYFIKNKITRKINIDSIQYHDKKSTFSKKHDLNKLLVSQSSNINNQDERGQTFLHIAINNNDIEEVALLICNGADVNIEDNFGNTPLISSLKKRQSLLSPYVPLNQSRQPWKLKAKQAGKQTEIAKLLIEHNANVNHQEKDGRTALFYVDSEEIAELLIEHDADINIKDKYGRTPLFNAVSIVLLDESALRESNKLSIKNNNVAKLLIAHGAKINIRDEHEETPLFEAATEDIAKLLIENGARVNIKDGHERTPLSNFVLQGRLDIVKLLIKNGADVNTRSKYALISGVTPLHLASSSANDANVDIAKILIDNGAKINVKDEKGKTPLIIAIVWRNTAGIDLLLKNKADTKHLKDINMENYSRNHRFHQQEIYELLETIIMEDKQ